MPEGDAIFRAAAALHTALAGRTVTAFATSVPAVRLRRPERLVGQTVERVESRGKHLLCWFDPTRLALHTHMRMSGSSHLYRPGQPWRKPARWARVELQVEGWTAVCFSAPVVELLSRGEVARHPVLRVLGPDATGAATDLTEARRRLDARAGWTVGDALLDQRVLAGVGNVYKNELLFIHRVNPWTRVGDVAPGDRDRLLATASHLLKANAAAGSSRRVTTSSRSRPGRGADRLHVYGRAGRPCPRCGTAIRVRGQGEQARQAYWCPACQPTPDTKTSGTGGNPVPDEV